MGVAGQPLPSLSALFWQCRWQTARVYPRLRSGRDWSLLAFSYGAPPPTSTCHSLLTLLSGRLTPSFPFAVGTLLPTPLIGYPVCAPVTRSRSSTYQTSFGALSPTLEAIPFPRGIFTTAPQSFLHLDAMPSNYGMGYWLTLRNTPYKQP